jgi:hypothetical protein
MGGLYIVFLSLGYIVDKQTLSRILAQFMSVVGMVISRFVWRLSKNYSEDAHSLMDSCGRNIS